MLYNFNATKFRKIKKFHRKESFKKAMIADLSTILHIPKLQIQLIEFFADNKKALFEFLKLRNFPINARSVGIHQRDGNILSILQFLKPGSLEEIRIEGVELLHQLHEITETKQWKMAKKLIWRSMSECLQIDILLHFREIEIRPFSFSDENLKNVRDILLESTNLKSCAFSCYSSWTRKNEDEMNEMIDRIMSQNPAFNVETRRFSIPNSRDYFQLKFDKEGHDNLYNLTINKIWEN